MDHKIIYVMSPYTNKCPAMMTMRAAEVAYCISKLMPQENYFNYILYSPIVHWHNIAIHNEALPRDVDFWWDKNKPFMDLATFGLVLKIPGWNRSKGIMQECNYLIDLGKKILHEEINGWTKNCFTYTPPK